MGNWQEKIGDAIKNVTEKQEAMTATAQRGVMLSAEGLEKVAGYQLGLAGEAVDNAVAQVRLLGQTGNPLTYLQRQVEFAAEGMQSATGKVSELSDLVSDSVSDVAALFETTPKSKAAPRAKKAA